MPKQGPISYRGVVTDLRSGVKEDYFIVDAETKAIPPTVPEAQFAAVRRHALFADQLD